MASPAAIAERVHPAQVASVDYLKENVPDARRRNIELLTSTTMPHPFGSYGRFEYDALVIEQLAGLCEIIKSQGMRISELEKETAKKKKAS